MLNNVPARVRQASRLVVLRHPNSMPCVIFRKEVLREDDPPDEAGDGPTLGGMGVLDNVDEDNFEWVKVGAGMVLFTATDNDAYADENAGGNWVDRNDAVAQEPTAAALIEFTEDADGKGYGPLDTVPEAQRKDVIYALPGAGLHMPYEVIQVQGTIMVPPYTRKYTLSARDELSWLGVSVTPVP
jgi:hypothetical protein